LHKKKEGTLSFVAWTILGLISGFLASKIVNKRGEGIAGDILLGIIGAVVGGWLFQTFGRAARVHPVPGISGLNVESVVVAVVGAVVVLLLYHALRRR
jgi:uncharacterized membrane protein YeaQ/YmgE (transglycosylase-associated protein family)